MLALTTALVVAIATAQPAPAAPTGKEAPVVLAAGPTQGGAAAKPPATKPTTAPKPPAKKPPSKPSSGKPAGKPETRPPGGQTPIKPVPGPGAKPGTPPGARPAPRRKPPASPAQAPPPLGSTTLSPATTALDLAVSPVSGKLQARARYRLRLGTSGPVHLNLHPDLAVSRVTLDDRPLVFTREGDNLDLTLPAPRAGKVSTLGIDYQGNPLVMAGQARRQAITPEGLLLAPGGGWLPLPAKTLTGPLSLTLRLPSAWRATAPGARTGLEPLRSPQKLDLPAGTEPALVAAPYRVFHAGSVRFFALATSAPAAAKGATDVANLLAARDLELTTAPVTRLLPGTPAGTLVELPEGFAPLGGGRWAATPRVQGEGLGPWLATLAWAPRNHEVATQPERPWLVESLAAYTTDLAAEASGGAQVRARLAKAHLAAYMAFLRRQATADRPLDQPPPPGDPAWAAVVTEKGVVVWDLLRQALGDEAFFALLRAHQDSLRAGGGGWQTFQALAGPQAAWVEGWLRSPGLPRLRLEDVAVTGAPGNYTVTGSLVQPDAFFGLPLDLSLVTEEGAEGVNFTAFAPRIPFTFQAPNRPLRLVLDGTDRAPVVRRDELLIPEGIAPADGLIVYGTGGDEPDNKAAQEAADLLAARLKRFKNLDLPVKADQEVAVADLKRNLLLMGRPGVNSLSTMLADQFPVRFIRDKAPDSEADAPAVDGKGLWWQGRAYTQPDHGVVQIIANPQAPDHHVVMFAGLSPRAQSDALRFTQTAATFCIFSGGAAQETGAALRPFPDLDVVLY